MKHWMNSKGWYEQHSKESIRGQRVSGLLYATEASLSAGRVDVVDNYISDLRAHYESHGDLSGLAQIDGFPHTVRQIVSASFPTNPEIAVATLGLLSDVTDDTTLVTTQFECGQIVHQMFSHNKIDSETYQRLLDHL